jgi:alpha-galactosidase
LQPVSDRVTREHADLLVWFEPERVRPGTKLDVERSEWLLRTKDNDNSLLYLGNPACRQWLTDHVCRLIQNNGIKIYRQDHNFPPLEHWRQNEAEDRQGLNENLHVQGYLQFWDDLLARNPGLWIDSCASGGRRNDLETMRRSVPLHYTDYGYGNHPVKLAFHHTLYAWIPYFKECTLSWDLTGAQRFDDRIDSYSYHCGMAAMLFATLDIRRDDYDYALARKMIDLWRSAADLILYGDYYPLTPFHHSAERWVVRQFDRPERNRGLLQGIRFPASPDETITIHPQAIDPESMYVLENPETGETREMAGAALARDGFTFALPQRSGAVWFYQKIVPQKR